MITFSEGLDGGNWLKYANEVGSKIVIEGMVIEFVGIQCLTPLFVLDSNPATMV